MQSKTEVRDKIWNAVYSDPIFTRADHILFDLDDEKIDDINLLEASVLFDSRMGVQDCLNARITKYNRQDRIAKHANQLIACWKAKSITSKEIRCINALYPFHDFLCAIDNPDDAKLTRKNFRVMAETILDRKIPMGFDMLELLVNAREICKKLPQKLSSYIKDLFEGEVNSVKIWKGIVNEKNLYDRVRRLSIQCRALEQRGFDVEKSYPNLEMQNERGEIFFTKDSRCHVVFSRQLLDFDWWFASADYLERYRQKLTDYAEKTTDRTEILHYATAILNIRLKQGVNIFVKQVSNLRQESNPNTRLAEQQVSVEQASACGEHPTLGPRAVPSAPSIRPEQIKDPTPGTRAVPSAPSTGPEQIKDCASSPRVSDKSDKSDRSDKSDKSDNSLLKEEWIPKAAECCERMVTEGITVEDFCIENNLPFKDFNPFIESLTEKLKLVWVAHENAIKTDPDYRRKEIEVYEKRLVTLYAEQKETHAKLSQLMSEIENIHQHLSTLRSLPN